MKAIVITEAEACALACHEVAVIFSVVLPDGPITGETFYVKYGKKCQHVRIVGYQIIDNKSMHIVVPMADIL